MAALLLLATADGLEACTREGDSWRLATRQLAGRHVTSVIAHEGIILAGTTDGIWRSDDEGQTWHEASTGLSHRHIRWLAHRLQGSGVEFAGTEPAGLFVSHDSGATWRECSEVARLRDEHKWSLPYSPEAGCVRGFAFHGARAYAAVEVGGVLRSDDSGESWRLAGGSTGDPDWARYHAPLVHPDVHSIEIHPSSPDLVLAPTGGGFYRSADGGQTWQKLYDCYCRAVWLDPSDAAHMILGPADSVDSNGRIEESRDGGKTWNPASQGLVVPWRRHMVERFIQVEDDLLAVLSNGQLLRSNLAALDWQPLLPDVPQVNAVAAV